ncbi:MAG: SDR family NAD(P)-dependent oxidoreductase [Pseudomonadota bacterium]
MSAERKVILITGGAKGIGRALSEAAASAGYAVVVNYRTSKEAAEELVAGIRSRGGESICVAGDVTLVEDVNRLVSTTLENFGQIDCLINNAGVADIRAQAEADERHFDDMLRANVKTAFLMSQAVIVEMTKRAKGGRLVFLSSLATRTGGVVSPAYAASKAALEGLMHYYATYLLSHRITANAIAPGLVESDMTNGMQLPPLSQLPLGRLGRADEMWPALRMILETEYMTGQTIHLSAGRYMT